MIYGSGVDTSYLGTGALKEWEFQLGVRAYSLLAILQIVCAHHCPFSNQQGIKSCKSGSPQKSSEFSRGLGKFLVNINSTGSMSHTAMPPKECTQSLVLARSHWSTQKLLRNLQKPRLTTL